MLAPSPPLFSTTYGWPLNLITQNLQQDCNEANSYHSPLDFPADIQIQHDFMPEKSVSVSSKGALNGNNDDPMKVAKKLNHNASERDRRKRVNELYSSLCSLLPISSDRTKKVSIPGIVSRALKYIPELQQEVEILKSKKGKLVSCSSSRSNMNNLSVKETMIRRKSSSVASSVSVLGEKEVVIQLIFSFDDMNKNKNLGLLSKTMEYLEKEESLLLLNATTFKCLGKERLLNTLHFQVHREGTTEVEKLKEKLCSLHQE